MAMHANKKDILVGPSLVDSLNSSSSLRRKSLHKQNPATPILSENNDEAERLARRHELNTSTGSVENANTTNKRRSLGLGFLAHMTAPEMKDRITECIKLNTENKINTKNAFSLKMIDFMTYMIKKQDANMSNLQVASASLDVSTKIYGFRVDGVHMEIMKMAGGLDKQEDENPDDNVNENPNDIQESETGELRKHTKKKKKRNKLKIVSTADSLTGTVEILKPSLWILENEDTQTTDALFQVMVSNHANSKYYLHLYNDVIVDTVEKKTENQSKEVEISRIENFSDLEMCPPLVKFEFQGWTHDNEKDEDKDTQSKKNNENAFQFDLDASLPSENEMIHEDINYLDIQDEEENVDRCVEAQKTTENIIDLRKVVSNVKQYKTSEYSFLQRSYNVHWAGPSHWKINNFTSASSGSKIVAACPQEPTRKRKEIEINYNDETKKAVEQKFVPGKNTRLRDAQTEWCEENLTLPRDIHYNIATSVRLYLHELITIKVEKEDLLNTTHISDIDNYDYNNENDTSYYCPNVPTDDYETKEDNQNEYNSEVEDSETRAVMNTGDNLVAVPKLVNKISIAYSTRAKRIDMRQLKKSIWKGLTTNKMENTENPKEETKMKGNKHFSEIYKALPDILTKTNIEALSFPISFVSLLHLANEKTLKIESLPDMSDLIVEAN